MDDVVVFKAAHDMHDGVDLSNIRKELVAEPLALGRALDKPRDVNELNRRGRVFIRVVHFGKPVKTLVRDGNHADVRLNRAKRIVRRLRTGVRNGVKKRAFAHVRQAHNT